MKAAHINPFLKSTCQILEQLQFGYKTGKPELRSSSISKNIIVAVGITGELRGQVYFGFDDKTSKGIVSRMMGGVTLYVTDEIVKSRISELGNMICGNAATILSSQNINLNITPPSIFTGNRLEVNTHKMNMITIPIVIDNLGVIEVHVALEKSAEKSVYAVG